MASSLVGSVVTAELAVDQHIDPPERRQRRRLDEAADDDDDDDDDDGCEVQLSQEARTLGRIILNSRETVGERTQYFAPTATQVLSAADEEELRNAYLKIIETPNSREQLLHVAQLLQRQRREQLTAVKTAVETAVEIAVETSVETAVETSGSMPCNLRKCKGQRGCLCPKMVAERQPYHHLENTGPSPLKTSNSSNSSRSPVKTSVERGSPTKVSPQLGSKEETAQVDIAMESTEIPCWRLQTCSELFTFGAESVATVGRPEKRYGNDVKLHYKSMPHATLSRCHAVVLPLPVERSGMPELLIVDVGSATGFRIIERSSDEHEKRSAVNCRGNASEISAPGRRRVLLVGPSETVVLQLGQRRGTVEFPVHTITINPKECIICKDAVRDVRLSCGHFVCCGGCVLKLQEHAQANGPSPMRCPVCNVAVELIQAPVVTQHAVTNPA